MVLLTHGLTGCIWKTYIYGNTTPLIHGLTMKTQKILLLLHTAGQLHDGDGKTVRRGCKHSWSQRNIVLVQELCSSGKQLRLNTAEIYSSSPKHGAKRMSTIHRSDPGSIKAKQKLFTLQHKLLHFNLVELVRADDDAVTSQMDAAAGLQSFYFL